MHVCRSCGSRLHRLRRQWWQRFVYRSSYVCDTCGEKELRRRSWFSGMTMTCQCPRCGNERLRTFRKRDHIEGFQKGLFRSIQKLFGAKLRYCDRCRLQFYDLRHTQDEKPITSSA